jgi:hypothetical protein
MTTRSPLHDRIETVADEAELEESTTASGTCSILAAPSAGEPRYREPEFLAIRPHVCATPNDTRRKRRRPKPGFVARLF